MEPSYYIVKFPRIAISKVFATAWPDEWSSNVEQSGTGGLAALPLSLRFVLASAIRTTIPAIVVNVVSLSLLSCCHQSTMLLYLFYYVQLSCHGPLMSI